MRRNDNTEPGWYEDPEDSRRERYWNGENWELLTRNLEDSETTLEHAKRFSLGSMLFRYPLKADNSFKAYAVICAVSLVFGIFNEVETGTRASLIPIMTIAVMPIILIYIYVFFLPYLFYRRRKDKRAGYSKDRVGRPYSLRAKYGIASVIALVTLISSLVFMNSANTRENKVEEFLVSQSEISEILRRYNSAAGAAVGTVRGVSDGSLSAGEGITNFSIASSRVSPILQELRSSCDEISFPEVGGEGEDYAFSKAMNILKVACEVTPQQFLLLTQIFQEQVDENGTQARLDSLSFQLDKLNDEKRRAAIEGLRAMRPYANESQAKLIDSLLDGFLNQS